MIPLEPKFVDRPWGRRGLGPLFPQAPQDAAIGEVWFEPPQGSDLPLLKFIFTEQKLSVQVHPEDGYARLHHNGSNGKTEAWYILDARPESRLGLGLRRRLTPDEARNACLTGQIEHILDWRPVQPGDVVYVPAGTIHAIGEGLTLFEIQEESDITYRLYDYGRPRELHLEHGLAVSRLEPFEGQSTRRTLAAGRQLLVDCPWFRLELLALSDATVLEPDSHWRAIVGLDGKAATVAPGEPARLGQGSQLVCWGPRR
jgi:mannose-6-phosphate isomerase